MTSLRNSTRPENLKLSLSKSSRFLSKLSSEALKKNKNFGNNFGDYCINYFYLVYEYLLLCRLMSNLTTGFVDVEMSICSSRADVTSGTRHTGSTSRSRSRRFNAFSHAKTE